MVIETKFIYGQDDATGEYGYLPTQHLNSAFNYSHNPTMFFFVVVKFSFYI